MTWLLRVTQRLTWLRRFRMDSPCIVSVVNTAWTWCGHWDGSHDRLWASVSDDDRWSRPSTIITSFLLGVRRAATRSRVALKYSRRVRYV